MSYNKCSFVGHREIAITEELKQRVKTTIEDLIVNHNVVSFLFGSKSEFNSLCHLIVTELKEKYPSIKRISYNCKNEACLTESEKKTWEETYIYFKKKGFYLLDFEEEVEYKTKYTAGRASYVERNQAMINDSDYCVFYYNGNYLPKMIKSSRRNIGFYQSKSGTAIAYSYAIKKKKVIINLYRN